MLSLFSPWEVKEQTITYLNQAFIYLFLIVISRTEVNVIYILKRKKAK